MMEDQNKFDEILRGKFSSEHFPFDEENWERAEEIMESHRKAKTLRKTAVIFLVGLIAGVAIMLPFVKNDAGSERMISQSAVKTEKPSLQVENNNTSFEKETTGKTASVKGSLKT